MTSLALPTFIPRYFSPQAPDEWFGHLAFGHDLVVAICPSLYVTVGPIFADAYFGVCQTVLEKGLDCTCYALFSSSEDPTTNGMEGLSLYNESHYAPFSYLQSVGENSLQSFSDNSIDLLQVTDRRGMAQVFETWIPKVKPGGLILIDHVRKRDTGAEAWQLWEQIENTFPDSFAFHHAGGLGVLRKPGGERLTSDLLELLFSSSGEVREAIRRHYVIYSGYLDGILRKEHATGAPDRKLAELTTELRAAQHERMILEAELAHKQLELTQVHFELNDARQTITDCQDSLAAAQQAHEATRVEKQQLLEALQAEQQAKQALVHSFSWRITAPARDFMEWMRKRKVD